jgi:hypothetical protein
MSSCATQTFTNITQSKFDCLVQKAAASDIIISGNQGEATKSGITIRWLFDPASQTLELQCLSSPFFISCGVINGKLNDLVSSCP